MNAKQERAEIIKNAEAAYRKGEINAAQLLWIRIITAKYLLKSDRPAATKFESRAR